AVSPRLASLIANDAERLSRFPTTKAYFFNADGSPKAEGTLLKNPEYAKTLTAIAEQGAKAFYQGDIATDIIKTVQNAPGNPGVLA
ncbi:gamma-glutamyltransferase family protein, partial [Escherichia coli]|nr:gamma-glutamyltransferase family protein [Escherichia coli]